MESDAHGIMSGALPPADRPGCCSDLISSQSQSGSRWHSSLVQRRAALEGGWALPALHVMHCTQLQSKQKDCCTLPSPQLMGKGHKRTEDCDNTALGCALPC